MASKFPVCGICDSRHILEQSTAWCFECNTGLCGECQEFHLLNESHRRHGIIPLTEYQTLPVSVLKIAESCKIHSKNYQAFCHEHECSCCSKCLIVEHRNCKDLTNIHDDICSINSSKTIFEIESSLQELDENVKRIQKNRKENMSSLQIDKQNINKEIQTARHAINEHFDHLEAELKEELARVEDNERRKISNILASVERTEKEIVELQMTLTILKQHASYQQTFHVSKHIQHILMNTNSFIQSMHDNNELSDVNISLRMNDFVKNVKENIIKIWEIVVKTVPIYTALKKREYKEEKYAELGKIVSNSKLDESDVQITQANVFTSKPAQENEYETVQITEHHTDLCFIVMVKPGKDALKFGLRDKYRLYVMPEGFMLEDIIKRTIKCRWPYNIVQQYGKSTEGREMVITVGGKHILGPVHVTFRCDSRDNLDRLFSLVPIFIKRIQSAHRP
ncbi:unnamed protein product [Mytilus edulis]|uniref:B box-type domain-containing protein n=1 Tax=Mytilus edulis TaxID=6550 RepID=A0A8S3QEZ7_MYTED|nr:unnamed protein product [Mytilus edulis]